MSNINWVSFGILIFLFALVTVVGFAAARWRRAEDVLHLNEWGLGGRGFGTFVTWFLLGGDLYTAYTFIAVPALVFGTGAAGFFTLSYTILVYPIVFVFLPRLWSVARVHGYITPADFVRGRYGSRGLSLAVAFTGILAVMPYIALQLVGIQVVIGALGISGTGLTADLPLLIAFVVLAAFITRPYVERNWHALQYAPLSLHWIYWYTGASTIAFAVIASAMLGRRCVKGEAPVWALPLQVKVALMSLRAGSLPRVGRLTPMRGCG